MIDWKNNAYSTDAKVGNFAIKIWWDSSASKNAPESEHGYLVEALGFRLKKHFRDLDEAKAAGIRVAGRLLGDALAALPSVERPAKA